MKRFAAIALLIAGVALPACAQRGGARGGFSGHSSSGFHGGFTGSAPSGFSGSHFTAPQRFTSGPSFRTTPSFARSGFGASYARSPYNGAGRYPGNSYGRAPYRRVFVFRNGFRSSFLVPGYPGYGYPGYGYGGYPDTGYYGDSSDSAGSAAPSYDMQPDQQEESQPREPYYPSIGPSSSSPAPQNEDAVMLVFKDGRPSLEIHNYALTPTTLYVLDQPRRNITVDEIDLAQASTFNSPQRRDSRKPPVAAPHQIFSFPFARGLHPLHF